MTRTRGRLRVLLVLATVSAGAVALAPSLLLAASARPKVIEPAQPKVLVYLIPGASFEELLAVPEISALAGAGGAALMSLQGGGLSTARDGVPAVGGRVSWRWLDPADHGGLNAVGAEIRRDVEAQSADDVLVVVASISPSDAMVRAKDLLYPVVIARGAPASLFADAGAPGTLASDSTRRTGVVTDRDVRATILRFIGEPVPSSLDGLPLRMSTQPPPFELHERYLAIRRLTVPIQTSAGLYVTAAGLLGMAVLAWGRAPRWLAHAAAWLAMSVPILATALLAAGHLSTLSYATVVPFVVLVTAGGILAVAPLARRDVLLPPAVIGVGVLAYFLIEAIFGWTAALTTLLGGSELDGGRFFGLPNVFIGLLLGASLYVACRLRPVPGFVLILAVGLFAGLPSAGSNLGGAVSLFAAAGLWLVLRTRARLGWRELAMAGGVMVVGMAVVLLAHRFLTATPTHVTRFEEVAGRNLGDVWGKFADRMSVGWRLVVRNPFAIVPVLGIPATLAAVLRPPGPVKEPLARHPVWRDALLVVLLAGVVAILANDSWPAAVGLAFGLGLGGLTYVSLIDGAAKMEGT